jgi:hypothetical protein
VESEGNRREDPRGKPGHRAPGRECRSDPRTRRGDVALFTPPARHHRSRRQSALPDLVPPDHPSGGSAAGCIGAPPRRRGSARNRAPERSAEPDRRAAHASQTADGPRCGRRSPPTPLPGPASNPHDHHLPGVPGSFRCPRQQAKIPVQGALGPTISRKTAKSDASRPGSNPRASSSATNDRRRASRRARSPGATATT